MFYDIQVAAEEGLYTIECDTKEELFAELEKLYEQGEKNISVSSNDLTLTLDEVFKYD